jgi:hypothetical protein
LKPCGVERNQDIHQGEKYLITPSGMLNGAARQSDWKRNGKRLNNRTRQNTMKKVTSTILGLSLALAVAGVSFAAQATAPANGTSTATTTKKVRKHKKATNSTSKPSSGASTSAPAK